ncbi:MAG: GGDEF domain-containing protein [Pseudomonadota bacterium]
MIRRKGHIWLAATCLTVFTVSVVAAAVMLLYPREDWAWELGLSLSLTSALTFPLTWWMGFLVYRNATLNDELQRLVNRDRLTDAATRDYFFDAMEANPDAYGVSLVIDIDHFKAINDTHGHLAGDQVLRDVVQTLKSNLRSEDIICRFGGEEFVVFLYQASPEAGEWVAEALRQVIEDMKILIGDAPIGVTISIGGSLKDRQRGIEAAIAEADKALYRAKSEGRNRAIMSWRSAA